MVTSDTDLVNSGLMLLGERPIADLANGTDDVTLAARTVFPQARDWVLALHPWNRCVKQIALSKTASTPAMTWDFEYLYPSDALRILALDDDTSGWEIGNNNGQAVVWTNQNGVVVRYIFRNTNVNSYSPALSWTISAYVSVILAQTLTQHRGKFEDRMIFFERTMSRARAMDGQEQSTIAFLSTFLTGDVRLGG